MVIWIWSSFWSRRTPTSTSKMSAEQLRFILLLLYVLIFLNFVLKKATNLSFICFLGKSFIGCQIFDCKRSRDRSSNGKWSFSFDAFESKNLVVLFFVSSFYFCVSVNNCQLIMNSKRKNIWKKLLSLCPRYTPVFDRVLA